MPEDFRLTKSVTDEQLATITQFDMTLDELKKKVSEGCVNGTTAELILRRAAILVVTFAKQNSKNSHDSSLKHFNDFHYHLWQSGLAGRDKQKFLLGVKPQGSLMVLVPCSE